MSFLYQNGAIVPANEAKISVFDQGLLFGNGIFETFRIDDGEPVAFSLHYERLSESAKQLGMPVPPSEELTDAASVLLERNQMNRAKARITLTGGQAAFTADIVEPTVLLILSPIPEYADSAKVVTVPFLRSAHSALAGIKSVSYAENIAALKYARQHGADDAVFANTDGNLCEGATTNIFIISDDRILTPPLSSGCLPGTFRRRVLEFCEVEKLPAYEKDIPMPLRKPEFVFLTSSIRGLQPVSRLDDRELPIEHPLFQSLQNGVGF